MMWNKLLEWLGIRTKPINKHKTNWTEEDEQQLTRLTSFHLNDEFIAKKLGRTKRAIQQKRYNEKIHG